MNNKERNMYEYGYVGGMAPQQMPYQPNYMLGTHNSYPNEFNNVEQRFTKIEQQIKRLEQRINLIESPYQKNNNLSNEPDSNMYML